jgi:putative alpha-1,2-mannosidase
MKEWKNVQSTVCQDNGKGNKKGRFKRVLQAHLTEIIIAIFLSIYAISLILLMGWGLLSSFKAPDDFGFNGNILGLPDRTQYWTRRVQKEAYRLGAFGFCGNEDVGQLSAWYVLSAVGFAQICPADDKYYINTPLFKKIRLALSPKYHSCINDNIFQVECDKDPLEYPYIREMYLNGNLLNRYYLTYSEITAGGILEIKLKLNPDKSD